MVLLFVLGPFTLLIALAPVLPGWAVVWPAERAIPFVEAINWVAEGLKSYSIFDLFTFRDVTRTIAEVVEWPLDFMYNLLVKGFRSLGVPALPWVMIVGLAAVVGAGVASTAFRGSPSSDASRVNAGSEASWTAAIARDPVHARIGR